MIKQLFRIVTLIILLALMVAGYFAYRHFNEKKVLERVIERLQAETRIAEVLVVESTLDELTNTIQTKIKFLEYDSAGQPLTPQYFTFSGNVIQFQSLVIRFNDDLVTAGDAIKGRSAYLFLKAFMLDGENTQEYDITPEYSLPDGYKVEHASVAAQEKIWRSFWEYALDAEKAHTMGIKNAQIEAPGTVFLPGTLYTLKIEHDGGIRIDAQKLPEILLGEMIQKQA
ncbi:MAG: hypothetical protein JW938_06760 [Candidatus Omnitrophica bacterium]|nr:hypothetical protein [Candidatus Omnitrophota bacterium]